jgi:membrane peptidoglycan carboxypeptidase
MKPFSNNVIASLGGKDFHSSSFNCAIDSNRQIGSTIKPFIYYLGLKKGMTILTELNSSPTRFYIKDYGFYEPKNFNSLYANQDINMLEAIAYSDNIYAVKTGLLVGSTDLSNLLDSFDIKYINTPSSFLGSISTSLLKLTSMYNCLASEGKYYKPSYIESIYKNDGTLIYKNNLSFNPILSKNETIILNQALTSTFDKNLQGYTKPSLLNYQTKRKFAAKTGTTNQDNYVIGYNPSFTIGVWVGDINNNELNEPGKAKKIFK